MGIRGLKRLIEENEQLFLKRYELQQTYLVIDGPNIMHCLFETNTEMENIYGGDYNKFAAVIRKFFRSLKSCGVCPLVVMDGGHAIDDRKLATRKERANQRLKKAFLSSRGEATEDHKTLPILGYDLFIEVLKDMGIKVKTCQFEADKEIAVIANDKQCPVLSKDSDFYIVRIVGGFLPFDHLEKEMNNGYFQSKIYHVEDFISKFPKLGENAFPFIALLFGNDYTKDLGLDFKPFLKSLTLPKTTTFHALNVVNEFQRKIIHWLLKMESFEMAKHEISRVINGENFDKILKIVVENYSMNKPSSPCAVPLPEWALSDHRECIIASIFMTIVTSQRIFLQCQPEDFDKPSSYQCSQFLRQILYGILLKDSRKNTVEEFDRKDGITHLSADTCILSRNLEVCDIIGHLPVPGLVEIKSKSVDERKEVLEAALPLGNQFDTFYADDLELNFLLRLTSFWYKNALQVMECHLSSLVVCWIFLEIEHLIDNPTRPRNTNTIGKAVSGIDSEVLQNIHKKLSPYCAADTSPTKNTRLDIVHAFAQFQTCAISALDLHAILRLQFRFHVEYLFFGKFLHDFCVAIEKKPCRARDEFILGLLEAENGLSDLYKNIIKKIRETKQPS